MEVNFRKNIWGEQMDRDSEQVTRVLSALIETNHEIFNLSETLSARREVVKVSHAFQWSRNHAHSEFGVGPPYLLDWYVDAELVTGRSLVWVLELSWPDGQWEIESRIETTGDDGLQVLQEFPGRSAQSVADLVNQLQMATSGLAGTYDKILREHDKK